MKRTFTKVIIVLMLGLVGLGFYRGWFTLTVDPDKVKQDASQVKEKTDEFTGRTSEAANEPGY